MKCLPRQTQKLEPAPDPARQTLWQAETAWERGTRKKGSSMSAKRHHVFPKRRRDTITIANVSLAISYLDPRWAEYGADVVIAHITGYGANAYTPTRWKTILHRTKRLMDHCTHFRKEKESESAQP